MFLTAAGQDASGGVVRDELAAAVAGPGIAHRPAQQSAPSGTDPVAIASGIVAIMLFLLMPAVEPGHAGDEYSPCTGAGLRGRAPGTVAIRFAPVSGEHGPDSRGGGDASRQYATADLPRGQTPCPAPA